MEPKTTKYPKGLLICILLLVLCATAASVVTMTTQFRMQGEIDKILNQNTDLGQEDDVTIADEYTIRSTLQISDAYHNGTEDRLSDKDKETLDMAKQVLSKIVKDGMNDYEKEEAVYLWLTKEMKPDTGMLTVIPTTSEGADEPFGVLKDRNAVCVGYATTFRLLMQMMNIQCKVIHNKDLYHSWNLVLLDDEWYHVDCYSDANSGNYKNFNLNDTRAESEHDWNHEFFPAATGTKYSYPSMHSEELKDIYALPKKVRKMLDDKQDVAAFTFKKKVAGENESEAAALVSSLSDYLSNSSELFVEMLWSENESGDYVLSVYVNRYDEENEIDVDDQTRTKIDKAVSEAFSDYELNQDTEGDMY